MSIELKVKAKSLADESRIIREEELKAKRSARWHRERQNEAQTQKYEKDRLSLYDHRRGIVRWESRATHLARAFMKGYAYKDIERPSHKTNKAGCLPKKHGTRIDPKTKDRLIKRVHKLLKKYHDKTLTEAELLVWFYTE